MHCNIDTKDENDVFTKLDITNEIAISIGFILSDWQKKYLFSSITIPPIIENERQNGKTTIYIVRLILTHLSPIPKSNIWAYSDKKDIRYAKGWFTDEFLRLHELLDKSRLQTVQILNM